MGRYVAGNLGKNTDRIFSLPRGNRSKAWQASRQQGSLSNLHPSAADEAPPPPLAGSAGNWGVSETFLVKF